MQKFENGILKINVSNGIVNSSQRNNQYVHKNSKGKIDVSASSTCNCTAMVMALEYNGWCFPEGEFTQPEDNLAKFIIENDFIDNLYKVKYPVEYKNFKEEKDGYYTPNELHELLAVGTNRWLKNEAVKFETEAQTEDIIRELVRERACVLSGKFGKLNHIVTLVGCEWDLPQYQTFEEAYFYIQNCKKIPDRFIIDDPWGDFHDNYKTTKGNDIVMSKEEFFHIFKPIDNRVIKWCHFVKSGTAAF